MQFSMYTVLFKIAMLFFQTNIKICTYQLSTAQLLSLLDVPYVRAYEVPCSVALDWLAGGRAYPIRWVVGGTFVILHSCPSRSITSAQTWNTVVYTTRNQSKSILIMALTATTYFLPLQMLIPLVY